MTGEERRKAMLRQREKAGQVSSGDDTDERLRKRKAILEQTQKRLKKQKRLRQLKMIAMPAAALLLVLSIVLAVKGCAGKAGKGTAAEGMGTQNGLVTDAGTPQSGQGGPEESEGAGTVQPTQDQPAQSESAQTEQPTEDGGAQTEQPAQGEGTQPEQPADNGTDQPGEEQTTVSPAQQEPAQTAGSAYRSGEGIRVDRIPVEPPAAAPTVNHPQQPDDAAQPQEPVSQGPFVDPSGIVMPSWITQAFIHINPVSRPAVALDSVDYIVIHYVGNPGSTAMGNREYFDSLDNPNVVGAGRQASAQLIVGLDGEVIQCLPLNELAYATGVADLNRRTISIEVCHPDWGGQFSAVTYQSLVRLTAWLLQQEHLTPDRLLRHYDCSGKACPAYYVEHPEAWEQLKADIAAYYNAHPNIQ